MALKIISVRSHLHFYFLFACNWLIQKSRPPEFTQSTKAFFSSGEFSPSDSKRNFDAVLPRQQGLQRSWCLPEELRCTHSHRMDWPPPQDETPSKHYLPVMAQNGITGSRSLYKQETHFLKLKSADAGQHPSMASHCSWDKDINPKDGLQGPGGSAYLLALDCIILSLTLCPQPPRFSFLFPGAAKPSGTTEP